MNKILLLLITVLLLSGCANNQKADVDLPEPKAQLNAVNILISKADRVYSEYELQDEKRIKEEIANSQLFKAVDFNDVYKHPVTLRIIYEKVYTDDLKNPVKLAQTILNMSSLGIIPAKVDLQHKYRVYVFYKDKTKPQQTFEYNIKTKDYTNAITVLRSKQQRKATEKFLDQLYNDLEKLPYLIPN